MLLNVPLERLLLPPTEKANQVVRLDRRPGAKALPN